jgi:ribonucleoside-diphosphate reductase subunit M1
MGYLYSGIQTVDLDNLLAETTAYLTPLHPDYSRLAARVAVTKLHKETSEAFLEVVNKLYFYVDSTGTSDFHDYLLLLQIDI